MHVLSTKHNDHQGPIRSVLCDTAVRFRHTSPTRSYRSGAAKFRVRLFVYSHRCRRKNCLLMRTRMADVKDTDGILPHSQHADCFMMDMHSSQNPGNV